MNLTIIRLPYFIVYIVAIAISLVVFSYSWKNRAGQGVKAFAVSILLEIFWLFGYMFELASPTFEGKLFWDNFQYIGALFVPISLLIFALQFTGRRINLKNWVASLILIPAILQIIILLDLTPQLLHVNAVVTTGLPFDEFSYDFGTLTLIANAYAYLLSLAYVIVLISGLFRKNIFRAQLGIVTFGTVVPILGLIITLSLGLKFGNQRDTSPLMFALSNLVIAWGIFRMRLFNVVPIAREILFENMRTALIILDQNDRILDTNPVAREVLGGRNSDELIGTHISLLQPVLYQQFGKAIEVHTEITNSTGETFDFSITPLYNKRGLLMGRLINANNISQQKRVETDLQSINAENQLRATRLRAISDVSQAISQIRDLKTLLPLIAQQISSKFDFYHVGIFLFSEDKKFAELIAANSEGGKRMLERGHRLELGQVGVVGRVARDGTPRVALDVGQDAVYFDNPDLPETHSEMALPLKAGSEIIGVLDVQSKRKNIFSSEDTEVFSSLANQVAIAIDNARQVAATEAALEEARSLSQEYIREAWTKLAETQTQTGYRYVNNSVFPILEQSEAFTSEQENMSLIEVPVELRGEKIGVLKVRMQLDAAENLTTNDRELLRAVAERAGLALENARLLQEAQRRAGKEGAISQFATTISEVSDTDKLMSVAVRELQKILHAAEVSFELSA